jgi:hypothetical protein
MDDRFLGVIERELEPETSAEAVVRSARIIVRLSHSLCGHCGRASSLRSNVEVGHIDKGVDGKSPVFSGVCQ